MTAKIRTGVLDVFLLGRLVGRIDFTSHRNEMRFAYDADYLAHSVADALSVSFPCPIYADILSVVDHQVRTIA